MSIFNDETDRSVQFLHPSRVGSRLVYAPASLRGFAATARHPSRVVCSLGLPSGPPARLRRYGAASFAGRLLAWFTGPPARLRRYGAASFAGRLLAWFTEPKLAEGERRMVDHGPARWNRLAGWLRSVENLRRWGSSNRYGDDDMTEAEWQVAIT